ncbi:MAG TPA: radical SAM family heme chaperone HemW [Gemmatimonadales bacterium]
MRHLYIHVPFCRRRCSYCDFAIAVRRDPPHTRFVAAVRAELEHRLAVASITVSAPLHTLYIGGGTPTQLAPEAIAALIALVPCDVATEVTIEANPDDVTETAATAWRKAGVNRVSLGVQSFHDTTLAWMHRTHGAADAVRAFAILRDAGFGSISLDLIFGVPDGLGRNLGDDLDRTLALEPDHVSAYGLTVEPSTPLARWVARDGVTMATDARFASEFLAVDSALAGAGFEHYEISNYAMPNARARHNSAYWVRAPYGGLGPSAHGFDGRTRRWNQRHWTAYERAVTDGADPMEGSEIPDRSQQALERLYLGLRTSDGVDPAVVGPFDEGEVAAAIDAGWLTRSGSRLRCTVRGWLVLDGLAPRLTTRGQGG